MADKNIGLLPQASTLTDDSSFVCEDSGTAKRVTGKQFKDFAKKGVSDEAEAQILAIQSAGDVQTQRVTDEGTAQTANVKAHVDDAKLYADEAKQSAQEAASSASVASAKANDAAESARSAEDNASKAAKSASSAANSAYSASYSEINAMDAASNAITQADNAKKHATAAAQSATDAQSAMTAAQTAQSGAEAAHSAAESAASSASTSARQASVSEQNAAGSATAAAQSAASIGNAEQVVTQKAEEASTSAANAAASAEAAEKSAEKAASIAGDKYATKTEAQGYADAAESNAKSYTDQQISAIPTPDVSGQIGEHNTNTKSHNDIRELIVGLTNRLNTLADSDDTTLDQFSEVVAYIKNNKSLIDGITTSKVNVADIINNLTTNVSNKPLSAAQGVVLKALIDAITVPTKVSELENDSGYLTHYTETDPTVPAWAKAKSKPTYTASEVGAVPTSRTVNGKALSSNITLNASDVNARPNTWTPSASDVGALPISGGIVTGNITAKYLTGTWLQATESNHSSTTAEKVAVFDTNGWLYHRTAAELRDDIGAVPTSRTVNGKALNANITLAASDVDAYSKSETDSLLSGKAASSHTHGAGDITSGTFASARLPTVPVNKGGTGRTTLTSGRYLAGNGTSAVTLKTAAQVASDIGAQFKSGLTEYALDRASSVTAGNLYYLKMENGVSVIRGVVGGSFTLGTVIGTLPSGYRPVSAFTGIAFATATSGTSLCTYEIIPDGTITLKNLIGTYQYITLSAGIFKSA